ncbi:MAG: hypothetical protein H0W72_13660 [Planctomycetes bacterium]|nr:hypothetical protein [Planctomycetota bacterium]
MPAYQPYWCEENIWHLAGDPAVGDGERVVVFCSGVDGHVACWHQRAAPAGEAVVWDYHVVLAVGGRGDWRIWDLDSRLGCPLPALTWLAGTFLMPAGLPPRLAPRFLPVPAAAFRGEFASDRAHMRTACGGWQQPPPPWPAITGGGVPMRTYLGRARRGIERDALAVLWSRDG